MLPPGRIWQREAPATPDGLSQLRRLEGLTFPSEYLAFLAWSNGGGEYVAFDMRAGRPWPVVALDMTNIDLPESVMPIANDFASFIGLVGIEALDP